MGGDPSSNPQAVQYRELSWPEYRESEQTIYLLCFDAYHIGAYFLLYLWL
jgi:hypothetical protein